MKKALIIGGIVVGGYIGYRIWAKQPKAAIYIADNGTGYAVLGNKRMDFTATTGVVIPSWNGYELSASGDGKYALRRFGKNVESGTITKYDGGTDRVQISRI